jgi:hypothetical protein
MSDDKWRMAEEESFGELVDGMGVFSEEQIDAVEEAMWAVLPAGKSRGATRDECNRAVLTLLAAQRRDTVAFLRNPKLLETNSPHLERLMPFLREVMEAAAQGVDALPLIPRTDDDHADG